MSTDVAIVVPAFGSADLLWLCVAHALGMGGLPDAHLVLADDRGDERAVEQLGRWLARLGHTYLQGGWRSGPYVACNRAVEALGTVPRVIVFLNADTCPFPGSILAMAKRVERGTHVVCARQALGPFSPADFPRTLEALADGEVPAYHGAAFATSGECWSRIGPFDERFRLSHGDIDWFERCRREGVRVVVALDAIVYHLGSAVRRRELTLEQDVDLGQADQAAFQAKWADAPDVLARHPLETVEQMRSGRALVGAWKANR